jgi:Lecithin:cholesterol acyltransferase
MSPCRAFVTCTPLLVAVLASVALATSSDGLAAAPPIVYIPGFEGTLLAEHVTPLASIARAGLLIRSALTLLGVSPAPPYTPAQRFAARNAAFLAPTNPTSFPALALRLSQEYRPDTHSYRPPRGVLRSQLSPHPDALAASDYPVAGCAPTPSSRIAHCLPVPVPGPFAALTDILTARYNYTPGVTLHAAPYDWRLPPSAILDPRSSSWRQTLTGLLDQLTAAHPTPAIVIAHGYGCVLAARFLESAPPAWRATSVSRLFCLAPTHDGGAAASAALRLISGHMPPATPPRTLRSADGIPNPRERLDFRQVEFALGLRRGRRAPPLPDVAGPWDEVACPAPRSWPGRTGRSSICFVLLGTTLLIRHLTAPFRR